MGYVYLFRCITWTLWEYCATPASAQNVHGPRRLPISKAVAHGLARHSCTALCLVAPLRWGKRDGPKHYLCKWQSNLLTAQNNGTDVMRLETAKLQSLCAWLLIYILTLNNDKWHTYIIWKTANIPRSFSLSRCLSILILVCVEFIPLQLHISLWDLSLRHDLCVTGIWYA